MRTAKQAAAFFKRKTSNKVGLCLWHVQEAFDSPHMYPNAITQWHQAEHKHPGDKTPPVGAPVCYKGGKHGHIAIYVGNGKVRSTDVGGRGRMGTVPLNWFAGAWGYEYLGWIGDIGGRNIDFDTDIKVYFSKLKPGVDDSDSVKQLRYRLIKRGFLKVSEPLGLSRPGNKYTNAVKAAVKKWQKKKGHRQTGVFTKDQAKQFFAPNKKVKVIV